MLTGRNVPDLRHGERRRRRARPRRLGAGPRPALPAHEQEHHAPGGLAPARGRQQLLRPRRRRPAANGPRLGGVGLQRRPTRRSGRSSPPERRPSYPREQAMPEGDTIHYAAHRIRPVLEGRVPDELATPHPRFAADRWPEKLAGRAVEAVDAHGKHLFLRFEGGRVIHSHLRMTGAWGVYRDGQRWGRSPRRAWLVLRAARPRCRAVRRSRARAHDRLARALRSAHRRPRPRHPRRPSSTRAASCRACAPTTRRGRSATPCSTSARSRASATCGSARAASTPASIPGVRRATSPTTRCCGSCASRGRACSSPRARASRCAAPAIYGHAGRPCPRCGTKIRARGQGDDNRTTYWCPGCQH